MAGIGSGLITVFFGTEDASAVLLTVFVGALFGVPATIFLALALFAHSAEPFTGRDTPISSGIIAAIGLAGIIMLAAYYFFLFF